jgi:hypothetical protein
MKLIGAILITILFLSGAWFYLDPNSSKLLIPLLIAGGLASVVQSLVENKNTIVLPGPGDAHTYQLGFIGDILIGMVGAFASLIVGLAVLTDNCRAIQRARSARTLCLGCEKARSAASLYKI